MTSLEMITMWMKRIPSHMVRHLIDGTLHDNITRSLNEGVTTYISKHDTGLITHDQRMKEYIESMGLIPHGWVGVEEDASKIGGDGSSIVYWKCDIYHPQAAEVYNFLFQEIPMELVGYIFPETRKVKSNAHTGH